MHRLGVGEIAQQLADPAAVQIAPADRRIRVE